MKAPQKKRMPMKIFKISEANVMGNRYFLDFLFTLHTTILGHPVCSHQDSEPVAKLFESRHWSILFNCRIFISKQYMGKFVNFSWPLV